MPTRRHLRQKETSEKGTRRRKCSIVRSIYSTSPLNTPVPPYPSPFGTTHRTSCGIVTWNSQTDTRSCVSGEMTRFIANCCKTTVLSSLPFNGADALSVWALNISTALSQAKIMKMDHGHYNKPTKA